MAKSKATNQTTKFPETIYVWIDEEVSPPCLLVETEIDTLPDMPGCPVAQYKIVSAGTVSVTKAISDERKA